MGSFLSCSVEIQITNRTQDVTLRNPRTYFQSVFSSGPPPPQLVPGSSDTCCFQNYVPFGGVSGILVYEAESFTLAIYFSNPIDRSTLSMELGLELSPVKAHRGKLENVYARMAKGTYSSSCSDIKFDRVIVDENHGIIQLSDGPVKVTATMCNATTSVLRVVVEENWRTERGSHD